MHPKDLQLGTVSPQTERGVVLALLGGAALLRVAAWRAVPADATEIAGIPTAAARWGVPLVGLVVLWVLMRFLRRWLDLPTALVAGSLWAVVALAIAPPAGLWTSMLAGAIALGCAAEAFALVERRRPEGSWRLGASLGVLSLASGLGWLWLVGLLAWLPTVSLRFRGMGSLRLVGEVTGAAVIVFAAGVITSSFLPGVPSPWPDGDRVLAGLHSDELGAPFTRHDGASQAALDAWVGFQMAESDLDPGRSAIERDAAIQTLIWARIGEAPAGFAVQMVRRITAQLAGWPGIATPRLQVPFVPWSVVVLASWFGIFALAPSVRRYWPVYLGVLLPLLQVGACGLSVAPLLMALPFYCALAGYGVVRISVGRAALWTWVVCVMVVAAAWGAHRVVLSWS